MNSVATIVVTYNRINLLRNCLECIRAQTHQPDSILIVDNASTDGTSDWLRSWLPSHLPKGRLVTLSTNMGGAGGFAAGMDVALSGSCDWIWMMDDDAEPHPTALAELNNIAADSRNVYGSLATNGDETSWLMTLLGDSPKTTCRVADIPAQARVRMLPFLGFLIHRDLVKKIGLPDAGFFIAADDVEYCVRAQNAGAQVIVAGKSHIEHPRSRPYSVKLPGYTLTALELPPWKRYYDTRNRLLIARKNYGFRLLTQTVPGSFVRLFAALLHEPHKGAQLWAWFCGMFDGLLGIKGKRHEKWGIRQ